MGSNGGGQRSDRRGERSLATTTSRSLNRASRSRVVAVTGAASFLGKNLIGLLEEDDRVRRVVSVDVDSPRTAGQKTRLYEVDLTQPTAAERVAEIFAAEGVDTLVHLAFL